LAASSASITASSNAYTASARAAVSRVFCASAIC
jgi:hypothetical protein